MRLKHLFLLYALFFLCCRKPTNDLGGLAGTDKSEHGETQDESLCYVKGIFNGSSVNWVEHDRPVGWASGTSSRTLRGPEVATGYFGGALVKNNVDFLKRYPSIVFEFGTTQVNRNDDMYNYLKSFTTLGKWDFANVEEPIAGTKGIIILYTDEAGKDYNTIGAQTGFINITSATPEPATFGHLDGLKIKLAFSCTLYPRNGVGNPLTFANGEAAIKVECDLY